MKKKIISLLLALIMAMSLLPMSVLAADPAGGGGKNDAPTGFSFYGLWRTQGTGHVTNTTEKPLQLVEQNGEYVIYMPGTQLMDGQMDWDLRVQAPEGYTDSFSLYYITFAAKATSGSIGTGISDEGYSVNAASQATVTEDGKTVQSVQTDRMTYRLGGKSKWSETMTLTWTENGQEKTCQFHVKPYCDIDGAQTFRADRKGSYQANCPLVQVDESTYRMQTVQNMETWISLNMAYDRFVTKFNGVEVSKRIDGIDTTEVGTKTYTIELSDKEGVFETRSYSVVVETLAAELDYTPALDTKNSSNTKGVINITSADQAVIKVALDAAQAKRVQEAGGATTYSWKVNGVEVSTESTYTFDTRYLVSLATLYCTITNTVDGVDWSRQFSFRVSTKKMPGAIIYSPTVTVTNTGKSEYTVGHPAGKLEATVVRDANTPYESMLRYQWYSKAEGATKWTAITQDGTASVYFPLTNDLGTVTYCCVARIAYDTAKVPTTVPEAACATITVKPREWAPETGITGTGSEADPYTLSTVAGFEALRDEIDAGIPLRNVYFKMTADVTLPADWDPMGSLKDPTLTGSEMQVVDMGRNVNPFSATLDGDGHTLTMSKGSKPLLEFARYAVVKNLNIQGERIVGNGLLQYYTVDYGEDGVYNTGVPDTITIENCHIVGKTNITRSGFLGGYASGANWVTIKNCSVGADVVIGCDKDQQRIGSLAGDFNGFVINCTSAATVYGTKRVGGLVGAKGQSMGPCDVMSSSFTGKVICAGDYAGGIMASGYVADSAPNSPWARVMGCYVSGSVEGKDYVGGITGGEPGVLQCWGNGAGTITDNVFYGTLTATGKNVGGVAGKLRALNMFTEVDNNFYLAGSGADKGIGAIDLVDTTSKNAPADGSTQYVCTREGYTDKHYMAGDFSREDDPVGKDADKLAKAVTAKELKNGTVVKWLNASSHSYKNWVQGENGPVHSDKAVCYQLTASGSFKDTYTIGDKLDLTGLVLTAAWTDGSTTTVDVDQVEVTGFDTNTRGQQTLTLTYGAAKTTITVTVLLPAGADITVTFSLLGDSIHDDKSGPHTLADDNLEKWIDSVTVTVGNNATVLDVIKAALGDKYTIENDSGNYIQSITPKDGKALGEFTNGTLSGWMYTLNGVHPNLGVAQQYLNGGDVIVFHYTDDYTRESGMDGGRKSPAEVVAMIDAIGAVSLSKGTAISEARTAYDALTDAEKKQVTNYDKLTAAEAAYAKLVAEMGKKLEEIYKTTGDYMSKLGTPGFGSVGGEWMTIGLARSGRTVPAGYYDNVVKYVKEKADANERLHRAKVTDNARVILALTAIGKDVTDVGGHNLLKGMDSMEFVQTQGINGPIWTLIALDSHNYPTMGDVTREKLIQVILDAQLNDGGWDLSAENADPDMTAMAIQALAPYYKTNETVKAAVDKALEALSALQRNDGGFGSWGTVNSESCAQVIVALTALGIDPAKDSRFVKNDLTVLDALASFYVTGGGFKHVADKGRDGMATEQGYYALAAYYRFANAQTRLYDMTDVTIQTGGGNTPATGDTGVLVWIIALPVTALAATFVLKRKEREA